MNLNQLAKELCKREGKNKQVDIAQMKEVLARQADLCAEYLAAVYAGHLDEVVFDEKTPLGGVFKQALKKAKAIEKKNLKK